jgi:WD40 repeat protein
MYGPLVSYGLAFFSTLGYVLLLWGLGGLCLYFHLKNRRTFARMRTWPTVTGTLRSAEAAPARTWLPSRRPTTVFTLAVTYDYTVAGKDYVGHGVTLNTPVAPANVQAFIAQHPPGSPITVTYDPADSGSAYLDPGAPPSRLWLIGGLLCLGLAVPGCCFLSLIPTLASNQLALANQAAAFGHNTQVGVVAFAPGGRLLAGGGCGQFKLNSSICQQGAVTLWDVSHPAGARLLAQLPAPGADAGAVRSLAFSPDGATLAATTEDGSFFLVDVSPPAAPRVLSAAPSTGGFAMLVAGSPVSATLAVGYYENSFQLWDVSQPESPRALGKPVGELPGPAFSLAFSSNGRLLAVQGPCSYGNHQPCSPSITLWDVSNPAAPRALAAPFGPATRIWSAVAISPDGQRLAANLDDKSISLWDISNPSAPRVLGSSLPAGVLINGLAFSPDGRLLFIGDTFEIQLWDVSDSGAATARGALTLQAGVEAFALSQSDATLAVVSNGQVGLWDVSDPANPRALGQALPAPTLTAPH